MKKIFSILLALTFIFSIVAFTVSCAGQNETEANVTTRVTEVQTTAKTETTVTTKVETTVTERVETTITEKVETTVTEKQETTATDPIVTTVTDPIVTTTESIVTTVTDPVVTTTEAIVTTTEAVVTTTNEPVVTTTETTTEETTTEKILEKEFNENKIVFTFAAISDTHIESKTGAVANKLLKALFQLQERAEADCESGLGAVLVAGDLINNGLSAEKYYTEMNYFKALYEAVLDPKEVPMVYCIGNHDIYPEWTTSVATEQSKLNKLLGSDYFLTDIDTKTMDNLGCRHCVINGYHVLTINPIGTRPVIYDSRAKTWLDNTLKEITSENPNQYVIVLTHPMIYDTVYGSTLGNYWDTEDLTSILSKYPQVLTFSGHLHFPLNDPRSIMQTAFTSVGCASVRYMAIEDGGYIEMAGATTMKDKDIYSQGLLVEVDESGNMRLIRMDFYHEEVIGDYWEISHPVEDGEHLKKYTKERGSDENNSAPVLKGEMSYSYRQVTQGLLPLTISFEKAEDDEFAHDYVLTIYKEGKLRKTLKILADFYLHGSPNDMKQTWTIDCGSFSEGNYEAVLVANDSWGKSSEPLSMTFVIERNGEDPNKRTNAPLSVYADFDFVNGAVLEKNGNINIKMKDAVVKESKVKLDGKEYTIEALNTSKDKYVICTFNKLTTPNEFKQFAEKGFSVEAFYYAEDNGDIQGVVCGTQTGGWGLAITKDYKPYFITGKGTSGQYNASVTSPTASSKTDLVHVVAVYDVENLTSSIYVNGVLKDTKSIDETFCVGKDLTFNIFCLGADVTIDCLGGDFQTKNMTMLDAKIYTGVLEQSDVNTAYANALDMLK